MSHFTVGVILPLNTPLTQDAIEQAIGFLLDPYSENLEVDPYERDCRCRGRFLHNEAYRLATKQHGENPHQTVDEATWERWHEAFMAAVQAHIDAHPDENQLPDPACQCCGGTGYYTSQYNPQSKWDWYRIGGRWSHDLLGTDAPADGQGGFNFSAAYEDWRNNAIRLGELLERTELYTFFALVLPDGTWVEQAEMGWWAITTNDKTAEDWQTISRTVYTKYADHQIVLVDAHI